MPTILRRRTEQRIRLLGRLELFSACGRADLRRIDSLTTLTAIAKGSVLIEEERKGLEFFVVVEGTATATRDGLWLGTFGPGSFFGELALLDRGCRTATVVAETAMSVLVSSRTEFAALHRLVPSVATKMNVELSRRIRTTNELLDHESVCSPSLRPVVVLGSSDEPRTSGVH